MAPEVLYDKMARTQEVFQAAVEIGRKCGVSLKAPSILTAIMSVCVRKMSSNSLSRRIPLVQKYFRRPKRWAAAG